MPKFNSYKRKKHHHWKKNYKSNNMTFSIIQQFSTSEEYIEIAPMQPSNKMHNINQKSKDLNFEKKLIVLNM